MPRQKKDPIVPVTRDIVAVLKKHHRRTGVSPLALLRKQHDVPKELSASEITGWFNSYGALRTTRKSHIDYVLRCWSAEPDKNIRRQNEVARTILTDDIVRELYSEMTRTGVGASRLLRGRGKECPAGLNSDAISGWMNGNLRTARTDYLDYVLKLWKSQPDESDVYIQITDEVRANLRLKLKKTGLSPVRLFADRDDLPEGLTWKNVRYFISSYSKRITQEHYDFVVRVCDEHEGRGYAEITPELRHRIQSEIERTGMGIYHLLRQASGKQQNLVKAYTVKAWLNGSVQKANKLDVDSILGLYAKTPDRAVINHPRIHDEGSTPVKSRKMGTYDLRFASLVEISHNDLDKLRDYRDRYHILPSKIFKYNQEPPPSGLNPNMISNWLNGGVKRADPCNIKWVLEKCREWVKFQAE